MWRRRQLLPPSPLSSSSSSDDTDLESCFETGGESGSTDSGANLTDCDSDTERDNHIDDIIIDEDEDKDHPPEYYLEEGGSLRLIMIYRTLFVNNSPFPNVC
jgi:hypothetical protein